MSKIIEVQGERISVVYNDMGRCFQAIFDNYYDGAPDTKPGLATMVGTGETEDEAINDLFEQRDESADSEDYYDDSMDGDHESALASAGWGTDEDYGGGDERW